MAFNDKTFSVEATTAQSSPKTGCSGCTFVGELTMETMLVCVWLVSSLIHTISGCSLSAPEGVTGHTGGSVLLPCFCPDGGTIRGSPRWLFFPSSSVITVWSPNEVHNLYKDRVSISDFPGNMSLHLSDLTLSDGGTYRCRRDGHYRDIRLTVKGCVFSDSGSIPITGFTGHSVVLPCACTDVQKKPEQIKWTAFLGNQNTVIFPQDPTSGNDRNKHRVQLLDSVSPGNLSLRLSDLTLSDGGTYRCSADGLYRDIRLTVKGCVFSDSGPIPITGFTGHSVVLPCACTDVQVKPKQIKWTAFRGNQNTVIFPLDPTSANDRYKNRVQLLDSVSSGNLSLRLSDLTLSDGGTYRCSADGLYRDIRLTVKESEKVPKTNVPKKQPPTKTTTKAASSHEKKIPAGKEEATEDQNNTLFVAIAVVAVVTLFTVCGAVFYCRVRGRESAHVESRGPNEKRAKEQEEDPDSVTYSTVIHREKDKNTKSQNQTPAEDSTEYAAIKFHT
ncbi:V-set and immunoglobulin domain-containing protein 1-like [Conger conger]|uniref:V-set and immunoglobulin domain-containing protein 1-like n=1 Tax=Conger conger TaxID=82655 RepID=UPI002A5ADFA3|nr:V-set and immunoglobulin domain-containing protein 1-like [Conger conger]